MLYLRGLRCHLQGVAARQYDAWDLGMVSSDDFGNADVRYEQSFANIRASLTRSNGGPPEIPIVTGFLARGESTGRYLTASYLPLNKPWHKNAKYHTHVLFGISHSQNFDTWLAPASHKSETVLCSGSHESQATGYDDSSNFVDMDI